jgi:hypothetical protein
MKQETWDKRFKKEFPYELVSRRETVVGSFDAIDVTEAIRKFIRTELQKAREDERERIISLLDDDVKILLHQREAEIGQMNLEINQEDK